MKQVRFIISAIVLLFAAAAVAQNPSVQPPPAVNASSVNFPQIVPALDPITSASVSLVGNPGPGRYCYWIVTNYLVGNASPVKVRPCITNGPITLSGSNYDQITFNLPAGATSADILRTSGTGIDQAPQGSCACAVATGNTSGTVQDQSNSLSAYTVTTYNPSVLNLGLTNEVVGAGASHLKLRQNGQLVGDISALANGLADPGANGIVFRSSANTTRPAVLGDVTALGATGTGNLVLANAATFTVNPTFASQTGTGAVVLANSASLTGSPSVAGYGPLNGTNSWTGANTFTGGAIVPTQSIADSSSNAASTAYVKHLVFISQSSFQGGTFTDTSPHTLESFSSLGGGTLNVLGKAIHVHDTILLTNASGGNVLFQLCFNTACANLLNTTPTTSGQDTGDVTLDCITTLIGASGTLSCDGTLSLNTANSVSATANVYALAANVTGTVDLTGAVTINDQVTFGTANASNFAESRWVLSQPN